MLRGNLHQQETHRKHVGYMPSAQLVNGQPKALAPEHATESHDANRR